MYLKKLELAGFKSFGGRTTISLEQGLTAIVGPNGSGKSNIADAVRWVLGEQSTKLLRLAKSEELIFAGTQRKARASMAEVSLLLSNERGVMPVDAAEVQITRRLYRNGTSEYLLNGSKIRHAALQELLAQAGFGQNSYAVIGQGMVDRLLLASPVERKTLFEEASGTKKFELKRDDQVRKLEQTRRNITDLTAMITELTPRHKAVEAEAQMLARKEEVTAQLAAAKQSYLARQLHSLAGEVERGTLQREKVQSELSTVEAELAEYQASRSRQDAQVRAQERARATALGQHAKLTEQRTQLVQQIAETLAQQSAAKTAVPGTTEQERRALERERKACIQSLGTIRKKLSTLEETIGGYDATISHMELVLKELNTTLASHRRQLQRGQKREYLNHALGLLNLLAQKDNILTMKKSDRDIAMHKMRRMIKLAIDDQSDIVAQEISSLQVKITRQMSKREDQIELRSKEIIRQRGLEIDYAIREEALAQLEARLQELDRASKTTERATQAVKAASEDKLSLLRDRIAKIDTRLVEATQSLGANVVTANTGRLNRDIESRVAKRAELTGRLQSATRELAMHQKNRAVLEAQYVREYGKLATYSVPDTSVTDQQIAKLEAELTLVRELDPAVKVKAATLQAELSHLQSQLEDLEAAAADLETLISSLEADIHAHFVQGFEAINSQFTSFFSKLFGGGEAKLAYETTESGDYGIEISATPPGKRPQQLAVLSGGERALGGIALLAAIMAVNPSPFVVLDEVDAALDDTNARKFNQVLKELQRRTQLIVITHNHETMQAAQQLIGITSDNQGAAMAVSASLDTALAQKD